VEEHFLIEDPIEEEELLFELLLELHPHPFMCLICR
jgi:hypothetical protein